MPAITGGVDLKRSFAPIALFAYNRPVHLARTLRHLLRCDGVEHSPVIVFADGPRNDSDRTAVEDARRVAREAFGTKAEYRFSTSNQGLAQSIIGGVESLLAQYGRVIVVEDDLLLARDFLRFMNDALDHYAEDERVYQVSGYMFDVPAFATRRASLLLPLTTTWGWATWERAWRSFDPEATGWHLLQADPALRRHFNLGGVYNYAQMLEDQMAGQRQSWGIRWYWSVFRRNGLSCFPPESLVANVGMDGSGTHGRGWLRRFEADSLTRRVVPFLAPAPDALDSEVWHQVRQAIWRQNGGRLGAATDLLKRARRMWRSGT